MSKKNTEVLLIGAGTMSSTLGVLLKQLDPNVQITMVDRLTDVALESTSGWNNAGTGHAAYCELNYTALQPDGSINIDKACKINAAFEVSLQFWSYLVRQDILPKPHYFINPTPHMSFVWGKDNVEFLRKRYQAMSQHHQFAEMEFSEDPEVLKQWMPLVIEGRDTSEPIAGTRVAHGSDVNFGSLSRSLVGELQAYDDFDLMLEHAVEGITQRPDKRWDVRVKDYKSGEYSHIFADFVFLGAGGAALPLLQLTEIDECNGYGGFPVSGQWLVCRNPEVVKQHLAKVYGKAAIGAPPMSVPHLDTRMIDGDNALLFGPFAGFTTKFLKKGSYLDLLASFSWTNVWPVVKVGLTNWDLIKYLISEVLQSQKARMASLRNYYPDARDDDWELAHAGKRVQIIKKDAEKGGKLEFGTEVVTAGDGTLAALLGASPGASTAVMAMLDVLERCFRHKMHSPEWQEKIKTMIPSYGESLEDNPALLQKIRQDTLGTLNLAPEK